MQNRQENTLNPNHSAPVGRLKLEVVDLKSPGVESSVHGTVGTATGCLCLPGTLGSFADEE